MAARKIFTIGYEQSRPEPVLTALKKAGVQILADTRAVASSRKPGFSKRALAASLDEAGMAYLHLQKLGTPTEGRAAARAGRMEVLWSIYDKHLTTHDQSKRWTNYSPSSAPESGFAFCASSVTRRIVIVAASRR